jgi:peptidoglycan/LPS O-acetylase OafA/YrhL
MLSRINLKKEIYPALTGIRAWGAIAVFFVHLPFAIGFSLAVDVLSFFFVLSGFLIVYLYYENDDVCAGRFQNYFVNRFARIYPVYFLIVTLVILSGHNFSVGYLFKNYTLTHALFHDISARAIQPSWSLTVEECFYLAAPLFMFLIRRYNFFAALLAAVIMLAGALLVSVSNVPYYFLSTPQFVFSTTFFGHFFEFFAGIFLALIILKREKEPGSNAVRSKRYAWTIAGITGCIVAISIPVVLQQAGYNAIYTIFYTGINNFILPIAIAVLYFGLITEITLLSKFLSLPLMGWLGRTSYAFYLIHVPLINGLVIPYLLPYFRGEYNLLVILAFIAIQVIAFLIYVFYEEPLNILIRKKFKQRKQVIIATA